MGLHIARFLVILSLVVGISPLGLLHAAPTGGFRAGLDFLEEQFDFVSNFYMETLIPYDLTDPEGNFVTQGALAGLSEEDARWLVAAQVDRYFRQVDVGDPNKTLRLAIYPHRVDSAPGVKSLNVAIGKQQVEGGIGFPIEHNFFGFAILDAYNVASVPDGGHAAIVWPDNIDWIGDVAAEFQTVQQVLNAVSGTAAQEIAHFFDLRDIAPHESGPIPIMATVPTGMTLDQHLWEKAFSTVPGTQPGGHSSVSKLISKAGIVHRADFTMSGSVDLDDAAVLVANWQSERALWHEGDATGDNRVDLDDASMLLAAFGTSLSAAESEVRFTLDATNRRVLIDAAGVAMVQVRSSDGLIIDYQSVLEGGDLMGLSMKQVRPDAAGEFILGDLLDSSNESLGRLGYVQLSDWTGLLSLEYQILGSDPVVQTVVIPEPSGLGLLASAGLAVLWRRRSGR
ncbi:MAG: PEP-CTERM sorting domain-containing protein [Phycisphaeraceae bacterium]|nr:PEP-CTERM sorting domain-containing protein [Phycisphaeraceae bacterium]